MAIDPTTGVFTYHDPSSASSLFFAENPTLGPSNYVLPLTDGQNYLNWPNHHPGYEPNGILDPEDPFSDSVIWDFCTNDVPGNSGAGPSGLPGEGCSSSDPIYENLNNSENPVFFGDNNPLPLSVFSVSQSPYNCTCCQILREITHTHGMNVKRLEIHGRFGVITHAVLGIYGFDSSFQGQDIQMFNFHNESTQTVKRFLVQYFDACKREGYSILQDPLSKFYEALCVGLTDEPDQPDNPDDYLQLSPENTGDSPTTQQEPLKQPGRVGLMKIPLAMQRERTRKLRLKDLVDYFDLPIEAAARKMNICPTVVKKICRKNGVLRWPYRKIKSIKRKISKKAKIVDASDDQERERALEDIQKHQQELAKIYEQFKH